MPVHLAAPVGQGPLAHERLHLLADGKVTVEFKRPWSVGTRSIGLAPHALLSRMAALVPPPKRHVTVYSGVLASNSRWRSLIIEALPGPYHPATTYRPNRASGGRIGPAARPQWPQ